MTMPEKIERQLVSVSSVIYSSPEQGFCIFRAECLEGEGKGRELVAKGHVGEVEQGDELVLWGQWENHSRFGPQVRVSRYQLPDMEDKGTLTFLRSGFVKGVGPSLAKQIWDCFGEDTARVLDREPDRLLEVHGVGKRKLETIRESWRENRAKQEALVKFQEWGIGPMTVQKIFRQWPENPLETVRKNPYLLAWHIDMVGFLTADRIALAMGVPEDSEDRIRSGIHYALQEASSKEGHCYVDTEDLVERSMKVLWPSGTEEWPWAGEWVREQIRRLADAGSLVREEERVFLKPVYLVERSLASHLERLLEGVRPFPYSISAMIEEYQIRAGISFDVRQREAIASALNNKVCIITGGPGTGKTTIVNAILDLAGQAGMEDVGLVAPTGRAAKRLEESSGYTGKTIHRYLGYNPQEGFQHHADNPVADELVVCDEASMLDLFLAKDLVAALPNRTRLILVGDVDQLPSVGAGNVLRDCIRSGAIPVTELETIHRQEEGSWIVHNAHAVKNGRVREINLSNRTMDFFWEDMEAKHPDLPAQERSVELRKRILRAMRGLRDKGYPTASVQVLTPMYKGPVGVASLNEELQKLLNPADGSRAEARIGNRIFREGDRVMQLRNDYDKEVFNGDQGHVRRIEIEGGKMWIEFDRALVEYEFLEADCLALAYACTIHKSQGSEFPVVIAPVTVSHYIMLQRNLLYTAITRAKRMCFLFGEKKALGISVKNDKPVSRNTTLEGLLRERHAPVGTSPSAS